MKLRLIRYSGLPVSKENLAQYDAEFKAAYDKIQEEHGQDMLAVHTALQELDKQLSSKWSSIEAASIPKSAKAWKNLLAEYDCPIMLARSQENPEELVFVIMDMPFA